MCLISTVLTDQTERLRPNFWPLPEVTREEFEELKREIEGIKLAIAFAKQIDQYTGQPDCEQAEKVEIIKRLAELVGVDLDDLLAV